MAVVINTKTNKLTLTWRPNSGSGRSSQSIWDSSILKKAVFEVFEDAEWQDRVTSSYRTILFVRLWSKLKFQRFWSEEGRRRKMEHVSTMISAMQERGIRVIRGMRLQTLGWTSGRIKAWICRKKLSKDQSWKVYNWIIHISGSWVSVIVTWSDHQAKVLSWITKSRECEISRGMQSWTLYERVWESLCSSLPTLWTNKGPKRLGPKNSGADWLTHEREEHGSCSEFRTSSGEHQKETARYTHDMFSWMFLHGMVRRQVELNLVCLTVIWPWFVHEIIWQVGWCRFWAECGRTIYFWSCCFLRSSSQSEQTTMQQPPPLHLPTHTRHIRHPKMRRVWSNQCFIQANYGAQDWSPHPHLFITSMTDIGWIQS